MILSFEIPAVPKLRPRATTRGSFVRMYKPEKLKNFEESIQELARTQMVGSEMFTGPLTVSFNFVLKKPKSVKRPYPSVKPDLSNLIKSVEDGLNGVAWKDDALICAISASKRYGNEDLIVVKIDNILDDNNG